MEDAKPEQEKTLFNEISKLTELSWQLNAKIFGERPETAKEERVVPGDRITEARNRIGEVNSRLKESIERLNNL